MPGIRSATGGRPPQAILREVARNQAMRLPMVRARAERRHRTGVQDDPAATRVVYDELRELCTRPLRGADVLEIGPGKGTGLMRAAAGEVASYAAFDVVAYLDPTTVGALDVDYRTGPGERLPWPDGSFDVVWSNSVLEHVRDPAGTLAECWRVLRPGGTLVAEIDLADHLGDRSRPDGIYACLAHPAWLWDLMADHRSTWVNRLRASDWRRLVAEAGFRIDRDEPRTVTFGLAELRRLPYLDAYADADVLTRLLQLGATRPGP